MAKLINKEKVLDALMTEKNFTAAAEKAGISRRTLYDYLHDDENFAAEYITRTRIESIERRQREEKRKEAERKYAFDVIRGIASDSTVPAAVRLRAAESMLEHDAAAVDAVDDLVMDGFKKRSGFSFGF